MRCIIPRITVKPITTSTMNPIIIITIDKFIMRWYLAGLSLFHSANMAIIEADEKETITIYATSICLSSWNTNSFSGLSRLEIARERRIKDPEIMPALTLSISLYSKVNN